MCEQGEEEEKKKTQERTCFYKESQDSEKRGPKENFIITSIQVLLCARHCTCMTPFKPDKNSLGKLLF